MDDRYVFSEHFPKLFVELDAGDYECGRLPATKPDTR